MCNFKYNPELNIILDAVFENILKYTDLNEDQIELDLYEIYSNWGAVSPARAKALKAISTGPSHSSTWIYSKRTSSSTSSTYRFMIRLYSNNKASDYVKSEVVKMAQQSGAYLSHKEVANDWERSVRIDPLIVYLTANPEDVQFSNIHTFVNKAVQKNAVKCGPIAFYKESSKGFYTGVQPTETEKEKGIESFGSTWTRAIARGIVSHIRNVRQMKGALNEQQILGLLYDRPSFNKCIEQAIRSSGVRKTSATIVEVRLINFDQFIEIMNRAGEQRNAMISRIIQQNWTRDRAIQLYWKMYETNERFRILPDGRILLELRGG